jgi:hypothetical protein
MTQVNDWPSCPRPTSHHEAGDRQEYRSAVIQFAGAMLSYRVAEQNRWPARHIEERDEPEATQEAYRLQAAMLDAVYALQFSSSDNDRLRERARGAVETAYAIREADAEPEMVRRAHLVRDAIDAVIAAARTGGRGSLAA